MNELQIKQILDIVTRMNGNSFKVKMICVALLGLMFYKAGSSQELFLTSVLMINTCLCMDFCYLKTEILYRSWYNFLQKQKTIKPEWLFLLNPKGIATVLKDSPSLKRINYKAFFSWSLIYFYLSLLICVLILSVN